MWTQITSDKLLKVRHKETTEITEHTEYTLLVCFVGGKKNEINLSLLATVGEKNKSESG